ncbi:hypothetical protein [Desulfopila aestuarii]|uniref:Uncharacterized protein n=1 Tax=Desulfopila aestuarii DSM 18488 TaxID=1121416 RepID=A0A1M7YAN8_9BACT|nr:hypothetical protein [Desulfopila aestuarii]SHO49667.1 hypothetical protein SAMN02745220_02990 [Desulfopila aestuarii DSM 18488]
MKLNDPFGRMANRHQRGYESMRDTMHSCGIKTPDAAWEIIRQSKKRAKICIGLAIAVLVLVSLLWPEGAAVTLSLVLFFIVWVATSALNGQRYIRRYIDEELNKKEEKQSDT